jgi:cell division initiation protein
MKLSPLDIRKQEFSRTMRGYDVDEVRAFLSTIASQMDDLIEEQEQARTDLADHKGKMGHLEDVQEALQTTLNMARKNAEETREAAIKKAEMIIHEAHLKGEEVVKKAERELDKLRTDITNLEVRRDQILAKIRSVLSAELEMLESLRPEPADKQKESGVEVAALEFLDPAARAHKQAYLEKAKAAAANQVGQPSGDTAPPGEYDEDSVEDGPESAEENPPSEQRIADVVAELKSSVDGEAEDADEPASAEEELDEMKKIRQILDDLE